MPRGSSSSSGVVPKRDSQRRRANKPKSYGAAKPVTGKATAARPELGLEDPHTMISDLWDALQGSPESRFYSEPDWQRVRMELAYGNRLLLGEKISGQAWKVFQDSLTELLVSPAAKRRAGIELKPPTDADEDEADRAVAAMQQKLRVV